jgi:micrococcal nuclease
MIFPSFSMPSYCYKATVVKVIDADTIDVDLDVGFRCTMRKRLRLAGIDAWETRGTEREKGLKAKACVERMIGQAIRVYVQTQMDAEGKYGRVLAVVWLLMDDTLPVNLNQFLLTQNHAVEY